VPPAPRVWNPLKLSPENELFVGRLAAVGLVVSLMGERLTGKGILAQLNMETGVPVTELEPVLVVLIAGLASVSALGSLGGGELPTNPGVASLGVSFTSERQRLVGRLSMAAFASALIAEGLTGSGPLDLLELDTGVPMDEVEAGFAFLLLLMGTGDVSGEEGAKHHEALDETVDWDADDADRDEEED
jgi:photosystem II 22kDa protein